VERLRRCQVLVVTARQGTFVVSKTRPYGGEGTGKSAVDRVRLGWKRSVACERSGIPIGMVSLIAATTTRRLAASCTPADWSSWTFNDVVISVAPSRRRALRMAVLDRRGDQLVVVERWPDRHRCEATCVSVGYARGCGVVVLFGGSEARGVTCRSVRESCVERHVGRGRGGGEANTVRLRDKNSHRSRGGAVAWSVRSPATALRDK
jgi:hypothetical protein